MSHLSTIAQSSKTRKSICSASRTSAIRCCGGVLTGLLLVLATARVGHTDTIAYEGFDYPEVGEQLRGKNGGFGFSAAWAPGSGIDPNTLMLAEDSLSFADLQTSGNRAQLDTTGGNHGLVRHLSSPIPANETETIYMSFLIRPERGGVIPSGWGVVGFIGAGFSGTAPHAGFGGNSYGMGNFGGGGSVTSGVLPVMNETSLFVVKADLMSGQDTFTFYVDPVPGEPEPAVGSVKTDADLQGLGWLYIAGGGGAGFSVDEIRLGDTYSDVTPVLECDFSSDGNCDLDDLNALLAVGPVAPGVPALGNEQFDLTGDGIIDNNDVDEWLSSAATENGFGLPYYRGDADLDGVVDVSDFNLWNTNKFTTSLLWDAGDFGGDGNIDVSDFNQWNVNKFTASGRVSAVPEPGTGLMLLASLALCPLVRRRKR